ncbi:S10 family peptidase [Tautonia sociabilis]|uniref:Peptidase S10 n=1 Tax=Tautonia sociabilis TaxID=2080755 RepID=A0A432MDN6_9BACT|nr:peptidase S10 [Tautonia sociabilis]RUL82949.1 peptidase S10 [Tautonia sociabilis]
MRAFLIVLLLGFPPVPIWPVLAQDRPDSGSGSGSVSGLGLERHGPREDDEDRASSAEQEEEGEEDQEPVVSHQTLDLDGRTLAYSATVGTLPIRDERGETTGSVFYVAYTLDGVAKPEDRPLMFSFNGGPGSSSVWLHLGALGPRRVPMPEEPGIPAPPYRLVPNDQTWLTEADLVFIDPIGTGYSRASDPEKASEFFSLRGDIAAVGEFIRLYLTRNRRWTSPLYLVGESYGTTRAAGLSEYLVDRGIALNGVVLVSSVLNFQTVRFGTGNDLPYVLFLPTYAATARYHGRLADDLEDRPLGEFLDEVEAFASGDYARALQLGDRLSDEERASVLDRLARYTGLDPEYLEDVGLRIEIQRFCKELLRDESRTVGRLDSRFRGIDPEPAGDSPSFDPSLAAIRPPYTSTLNQYLRTELGYESDLPYHILGEGVRGWDYGVSSAGGGGFADTGAELRDALAKNPHMRILVASGYYDLATPYAATEYTLANLRLDPELRDNIRIYEYEAGHMMYIHEPSLVALKRHVSAFIAESDGVEGLSSAPTRPDPGGDRAQDERRECEPEGSNG